MLFLGLDVHKNQSTLCALDVDGKQVFNRAIKGSWIKVVDQIRKVKQGHGGKVAVCFESSCGYGPLHDALVKIVDQVVVAHPGHLRMIFRAKKKNDKIDARKLAMLLFFGQVPSIHVPGEDVRAWREMINFRCKLVEKRTRVKNEIRTFLRGLGVVAPKGLWTRAGTSWLRSLEFSSDMSSFRRDLLVQEHESLKASVSRVERLLAKRARNHPGVALLMTIPGVGIRTAEALVAFIDDPHRFPKTNKIGDYFGLTPAFYESANTRRMGHITKEGPPVVRKFLTEAAWQAIRRSPTAAGKFEQWMRGDPDRKKIAVIAVAHYLARVSLAMLKTGETWREAA